MRKIKFRGIGINNEDWYCGDLIQNYSDSPMITFRDSGIIFRYYVKPETVGQYTGLKDKHGLEIWEGHIVKFIWADGEEEIGEIIFYSGCFMIHRRSCQGRINLSLWEFCLDCEILGNVHQNPELLESKDELTPKENS